MNQFKEEDLVPGRYYWACPLFDVDDDRPYEEQTQAVPARFMGNGKWEWVGVEGDDWPYNGVVLRECK